MRTLISLTLTLAALGLSACGYVTEEETGATIQTSPEVSAPVEGPEAPAFELTGTDGETHSLADAMAGGRIVVLEWFYPDCPVVKAYHDPGKMAATHAAVAGDALVWLAVNSGAPGKQGHGAQRNADAVAAWSLPYPVLLDESGEVGKAYDASNTPHMFVVRDGRIAYQGAIDDSKSARDGVNYVEAAVASLRAGEPVATPSTQSFGCQVKY